mmetsp:Transcript_35917/g.101048  ORF Transcript_35917/g.101048 Transcript_35917/m.101048 type:complete len:1024 (-) Transcript_35917:48-3119(-)
MADAKQVAREKGVFRQGSSILYTQSTNFKKETMENGKFFEVCSILSKEGHINIANVKEEVEWFFYTLGVDLYYFRDRSPQTIANHITQLYAAKIIASLRLKGHQNPEINVTQEDASEALYFCNSVGGRQGSTTSVEDRIDEKFLDDHDTCYRVQSYRSVAPLFPEQKIHLRLQFVTRANFDAVEEEGEDRYDAEFRQLADKNFLRRASRSTRLQYKTLVAKALQSNIPVVVSKTKIGEDGLGEEGRVVIAYKRGMTHHFFSALSHLYHYFGFTTTRKYVEQFKNGVTIISLSIVDSSSPCPVSKLGGKERLEAFITQIRDLFVIPRSPFHSRLNLMEASQKEVMYMFSAQKFCYYFLERFHSDWKSLAGVLDHTDPEHTAVMSRMKGRLAQGTTTEKSIETTLLAYPNMVHALYEHFCAFHMPKYFGDVAEENVKDLRAKRSEEVLKLIQKCPFENSDDSSFDVQVFKCLFNFNTRVLKTNFFHLQKSSLAFKIDNRVMANLNFVETVPFGVFMIIATEFRGFHVRFMDMARGGVRIIRSANKEAFNRNMSNLLEENYNLALTQQNKNKDIPEGGSKGTILMAPGFQGVPKQAFQKYVDGLLDLMLVDEDVVDYYQKEEIIFLGPDEGTADYMEWACTFAKMRKYKFWRAFTTGKPLELGGIPHDTYGMTTRSVHQYVLGILNRAGLKESDITKFQTGGPDGDLGSNEIKISNDRTTAIVDGSGVLVDPNGIHREELLRLANGRLMVKHFERSKLSKEGYLISIEDKSITLPSGELVESGLQYRNTFHLLSASSATLFVPCGGRPKAVDFHNFDRLLDEEGNPRFRYIVEGANLFFTQAARLALESKGVILFKDASANKGGVTSSSLEVLAALSFGSDEEFSKHMAVKDGVVPEFYSKYVEYTQGVIEENARMECDIIFQEAEATNQPHCVLTDLVSSKINAMKAQVYNSDLYENEKIRTTVLQRALPNLLVDLIGYDAILQNVPPAYLRSIFSTWIAARFVYSSGLSNTGEFAFFAFMKEFF